MADTTPSLGPVLLAHARTAIAGRLKQAADSAPDHPALHAPGASFVTLSLKGCLRGCIGQLEPVRSLGEDVRQNAIAAAFHDPRFLPLSLDEWPHIELEVSVLGPVQYTACPSLAKCLEQIVPFEDGVILASGVHRATFLPQVWEQLPEPEQFLAHLLTKAGLAAGTWPANMKLGRYRVAHYA
ncbi:AmmeMemoRadiSam system protein A [Uliginosibacterium gangwonense]|uniref:AmmeMemoRadiSam system protein A n=1 Tax=Uliginosibacterium gangwonense TaxID=392736 RepID=UPI00035D8C7A|nr:AmmeMemoRadiSam system protein A [Uliginosibacterium gangwonense]